MTKSLAAGDIMTTRLVTFSPDMDVHEAIGLLLRHRISGGPVVDADRRLLGTFSEKGAMRVLVDVGSDVMPHSRVEHFLDSAERPISADTDLLTMAHIFHETTFSRLPVVDDEGRVIGQVSRRDVLRAVNDSYETAPDRQTGLLYLSSLLER
ncbi:MAG: CBS domain-containing protein, partial [Planctomycetota bacterium]